MADNESETSEYTVTVGGVEHTVLLSEKDAESKSAKPANKSATPANKGTSDK